MGKRMGLGQPKTEASRLGKGTLSCGLVIAAFKYHMAALEGCGAVMPSGPLAAGLKPYSVGTSFPFLEASRM